MERRARECLSRLREGWDLSRSRRGRELLEAEGREEDPTEVEAAVEGMSMPPEALDEDGLLGSIFRVGPGRVDSRGARG